MGSNKFWQIYLSVIAPVLNPGGLFKAYDLHSVTQLSTSIEEMDEVTLNYWLRKVVVEAAKNAGESYLPKIIYGKGKVFVNKYCFCY